MNRDPVTGRFLKGMKTWNKGLFGWQGANCTSFTKDTIKRAEIGTVQQGKDQLVCVCEDKIPMRSRNGKVYMHQKRMSYAKWLMEKELGRKLDRNEVVLHIDGNAYNNDLDNLRVVTRADLAKMNGKHRWKS